MPVQITSEYDILYDGQYVTSIVLDSNIDMNIELAMLVINRMVSNEGKSYNQIDKISWIKSDNHN